MRFSKKILETFIDLPKDESRRSGSEGGYIDLMEDVGLEIKSVDGDIMNLELLANRGDHYCYTGLAREIAGRTGAEIKNKESEVVSQKKAESFKVETDKCLAYSLTPYALTHHASRITHNDYMLQASGVNVIHPVIDITNIVMLELGQPAHVYDSDKIKGKITIRESRVGEVAALLFHDGETELPAGTCVIADEEKILCVAGVIGCRAAEVDENTKSFLFETALFDPVSIRRTAKALGVSSIASQIFERGGDFSAIESGQARAKWLYKNELNIDAVGDTEIIVNKLPQKKDIKMTGDYVRQQLEIEISDDEIKERLARYGFEKTSAGYKIPTWRVWDIKGESADLIEELCRSIGYDNLPSKLPPMQLGAAETGAEQRKARIDSYLVDNGFTQVILDSMYSPKHADIFPKQQRVGLENSVDGAYSFMRTNVFTQAVELVAKNLRVKNREIRAYEWGSVFGTSRKTGLLSETPYLWGVMNGVGISALTAKELLKNLFASLKLEVRFEYDFDNPDDEDQLLMPKRRGRIYYIPADAYIGSFGEVSPVMLEKFDIKNSNPVYFVLNTEAILIAPTKKIKYESPSAIIPSVRDIAVSVPYGKAAGDVAEFIKTHYPQVAKVEITDVYDKPKDKVRSITFTMTFAGEHSAEELNKLILEIMQSAQSNT